jgi:hypothetical protein
LGSFYLNLWSMTLSTVYAIKLIFLIAGEPAPPIGIALAHGQPGNRDAILDGRTADPARFDLSSATMLF